MNSIAKDLDLPVSGPEVRDAMSSRQAYTEFYDRLGKDYPETEMVHGQDPRRYRIVLSEILPFARRGVRMLDVGCNDGVYSIPYCVGGGSCDGIDISPKLVERARQRADSLPATFEVADIETYRGLAQYDLVLMSEVLEHLMNPKIGITNALDRVRPGGHLLLSTPAPVGLVTTRQYLQETLIRRKLVQAHTEDTHRTIIGREFGIDGYRYRHDAYYPRALTRWIRTFGVDIVTAYTAVYRPDKLTTRALGLLESQIDLKRVPVANLFGETNFVLVSKP